MTAEEVVYGLFCCGVIGAFALGGWFVATDAGRRFTDWLGKWF